MSVSVYGLNKIMEEFENIQDKTEAGILDAMEFILRISKPRVPVDTGALQRSGKINKIENGYEVIYHSENPATGYNYAPIQHENLTFNHTVGQAKYLEEPILQNINKIKEMVVKGIIK